MSGTSGAPSMTDSQSAEEMGKITCHLVSLPKIILTRIDDGDTELAKHIKQELKKPVKRLGTKVKKPLLHSKPSGNKGGIEKKPRGRPKKEPSSSLKPSTFYKKLKNSNISSTNKIDLLKKTAKNVTKPGDSAVKNMLKKTMLQKRSKIAIPPAKKPKVTLQKTPKPITQKPSKQVQPKIKLDIPINKPLDMDTSEDEFLYDELIEELENGPIKGDISPPVVAEKTTNITLKPNMGNKPPTIVKGGIIKKANLPPDLKPIVSPASIKKETMAKAKSKPKKTQSSTNIAEFSPPKKPSPWPVSISSTPVKLPFEREPNKVKKKNLSNPKIANSTRNAKSTKNKQIQAKTASKLNSSKSLAASSESNQLQKTKPKLGPKQTAKVVPLLKPTEEEESLSDEYTEEETLEYFDSPNVQLLNKLFSEDTESKEKVPSSNPNITTSSKETAVSKDDEDPHLDLLRILTDDSEDPVPIENIDEKEQYDQLTNSSSDTVETHTTKTNSVVEPSSSDQPALLVDEDEAEPPVRTIYELMNDISLQYPSWNLHIIPETNAFCIAQVTKGRLGLPTLKKCIELDPNDYNAKVYIHQYHIKRFDGIYDSEESIVALIQEIHSIKA